MRVGILRIDGKSLPERRRRPAVVGGQVSRDAVVVVRFRDGGVQAHGPLVVSRHFVMPIELPVDHDEVHVGLGIVGIDLKRADIESQGAFQVAAVLQCPRVAEDLLGARGPDRVHGIYQGVLVVAPKRSPGGFVAFQLLLGLGLAAGQSQFLGQCIDRFPVVRLDRKGRFEMPDRPAVGLPGSKPAQAVMHGSAIGRKLQRLLQSSRRGGALP